MGFSWQCSSNYVRRADWSPSKKKLTGCPEGSKFPEAQIFSQAAETSGNSVVNFKPPNQVTQIRNTFILAEQKREFAAEIPFLVYKKSKNFPGNIAITEKHAHQS